MLIRESVKKLKRPKRSVYRFCLFLCFFLLVPRLILSLFHRLSLSLFLSPCPHRLSLFLFPCTFNFNVTQIPKYKSIQPNFSKLIHISYPNLKKWEEKKNVRCPIDAVFTVLPLSLLISFSMSQASSSLYFIASLFLGLSPFHRLSLFLTQNTNLLIKTKSDQNTNLNHN